MLAPRLFQHFALLLSLAAAGGGAELTFISRQGARIVDGNRPFDYVGGNLPEITHVRTDWDLRQASRMRLPTEAEIHHLVGTAAQSHMRVIRTWCFPTLHDQNDIPEAVSFYYHNDDGKTVRLNEEAFRRFDYFLLRCREEGVRVSVPFFYRWDSWAWTEKDQTLHPQQRDFIRQVITRVNTRTGVRYADDATIYAWSNGNEFEFTPKRWIREVAAFVKSLAPRQLFIDGRMGAQDVFNAYLSGDTELLDDPNIDIVAYHLYHPPANGWDVHESTIRINGLLARGNKALSIGEISPHESVENIRRLIRTVQENKVHSILYWSWKGIREQGGYMHWNGRWGPHDDLKWPGFVSDVTGVAAEKAKVDALVEGHYALAGLPRPPIPLPRPARLLPTRRPGLLTWQPGVGEQTADIERSSDGHSFTVVHADYPTFLATEGAMFADRTARPGETYFYRIRSRNTTGHSVQPSNVIGPVRVQQAWLIDSFAGTLPERSVPAGLEVIQDYDDARYHNALTYLRATTPAAVGYAVPGIVNQVSVLSHHATDSLRVEGSTDGRHYVPVDVKRLIYPALHTDFAGQPRVLTTTVDLTAQRFRSIRLQLAPPDVVSRVEIAYNGAAAPEPLEWVVDNHSEGFHAAGEWLELTDDGDRRRIPHGLNLSYLISRVPGGQQTARWTSPVTAPGEYEVEMRWGGQRIDPLRSQRVPVQITHAGGATELELDQRYNAGRWIRLGRWSFSGRTSEGVTLRHVTPGVAAADAVRWIPVAPAPGS